MGAFCYEIGNVSNINFEIHICTKYGIQYAIKN